MAPHLLIGPWPTRRYEPFVVAETALSTPRSQSPSVAGTADASASRPAGETSTRTDPSGGAASVSPAAGGGGAFNALAGYIFGGNAARDRMAMTTPVFTDSGGSMQFVVRTSDDVRLASHGCEICSLTVCTHLGPLTEQWSPSRHRLGHRWDVGSRASTAVPGQQLTVAMLTERWLMLARNCIGRGRGRSAVCVQGMDSLPAPDRQDVQLRRQDGGHYAAIMFNGTADPAQVEAKVQRHFAVLWRLAERLSRGPNAFCAMMAHARRDRLTRASAESLVMSCRSYHNKVQGLRTGVCAYVHHRTSCYVFLTAQLSELRMLLSTDGRSAADDSFTLARYNDPSTPPRFRRNEVLIPLKKFSLW